MGDTIRRKICMSLSLKINSILSSLCKMQYITVGKSVAPLRYRGYDVSRSGGAQVKSQRVADHGKYQPRRAGRVTIKPIKALLDCRKCKRVLVFAAASAPMDVMRTGVSALGCTCWKKRDAAISGARYCPTLWPARTMPAAGITAATTKRRNVFMLTDVVPSARNTTTCHG